jgi:hypothetical protein
VAAVRDRPADLSISQALAGYYRAEFVSMRSGEDGELRGRVMEMMEATPALQEYASRMWLRHEEALGSVITEEFGLPEPSDEIRIYARFALQIQLFVTSDKDPMLDAGFRILDQGWSQYQSKLGAARTPSA